MSEQAEVGLPDSRPGRFKWLLLMLVWLVSLFLFNQWAFAHRHLPAEYARFSYGFGFSVFALLMLGSLARLRVTPYLMVWRMVTLMLGTLIAGIEVSLHDYPRGYGVFLFACSVIGISSICLVARFTPRLARNLWLPDAAEIGEKPAGQ